MFLQSHIRPVSTGGGSSSYSQSETVFTSGAPPDRRDNDGQRSGTTEISRLTSPTAVESQDSTGKTLFSSRFRDSKHQESERSTGYSTNAQKPSPQICWASLPSGQWRALWARNVNRSQKSNMSQGNDSQLGADPNTQGRLEFLGYRQELTRTWDFWSLFSLSFCNVAVLPGAFGSVSMCYALSGPIMITIGMFITAIFLACVNASFGEMASAYPVAGAMFSWTFKLARANPHIRDWARLISWVVGFLLFVTHLILQLHIGLDFARSFTTVITASGANWHVTPVQNLFVVLGFICITGLVSCTTLSRSPLLWKMLGFMTIMLQLSVCIALLATSKKQRSFVSLFTSGPSKYHSKSKAWNLLFSWSGVTYVSGTEAVSHMTEESKNAAKSAPRAMFWGTVFTGFMQLLCCVCIGMAITPMRHKATGYPIIDAVFAHCPKPIAQFITFSLVITSFIANVSQFLATSRFFWALARDKALPFSKVWRKVTPDRRPLRATFLMIGLSMLFSLLALDPSSFVVRTFGIANVHLVTTAYLTPLILYVFSEKGVYDRDGSNVWTLGKLSRPITCISIAFLFSQFIIQSGPIAWPLTINTFPFAPFVLIGAISISLVFWFLYGRSHYAGPIKSLTTWTLGYEVEIPKQAQAAQVRHEKPDNMDISRTLEPTPNRSAAELTHQRTEFELPQAFCTYDSRGSLWSATDSQRPDQSFFN